MFVWRRVGAGSGWRLPVMVLAVALLAVALLSGCGSDEGAPPPTVARLEDLAAAATGTALSALPTSALPTAALPPTTAPATFDAAATFSAGTATRAAAATDTVMTAQALTALLTVASPSLLPPAVTLTATPTAPSATPTMDLDAQTATMAAQVVPITQTMAAIQQQTAVPLTETAQYAGQLVTLTATPEAPTFTPSPTIAATSYEVIYYTNRDGSDDIYLLSLGGAQRAVTRTLANEREPACAPDGSGFIFASDQSGSYQLYFQSFASGEVFALTSSEGMNFAPVYSADGLRIAFVSTREGGIPTIWIMNADGSDQQRFTTDLGRDASPGWGPDGRQLLFSGEQTDDWDIYLAIVGEDVEGEFPVLPAEFSGGNQLWPFFDVPGERLAYTQWADLNDPQTSDIYLLDFEQSAPVALVEGEGAAIGWSWADDARLLASVGGPDDVQIALVDAASGTVTRLTNAGSFNGGARVCIVDPAKLAPEPPLPPSPTPSATPTATATATATAAGTAVATASPTAAATPTATATATATLIPAPVLLSPELAAAQGHTYIVQEGDTLLTISQHFGTSVETEIMINSLINPDRLTIGQRLIVPVTRVGWLMSGPQPPDADQYAPMIVAKEIRVSVDRQRLYAYENERLVRTMLVSTGQDLFPTVEGEFAIYWKLVTQNMSGPGYYIPNVPYVMYFSGSYGLHGAYWHNSFGQRMSHGCVNLPVDEARWLFEWSEVGTPVIVGP